MTVDLFSSGNTLLMAASSQAPYQVLPGFEATCLGFIRGKDRWPSVSENTDESAVTNHTVAGHPQQPAWELRRDPKRDCLSQTDRQGHFQCPTKRNPYMHQVKQVPPTHVMPDCGTFPKSSWPHCNLSTVPIQKLCYPEAFYACGYLW